MYRNKKKRIHFIGIGGVGMSGIAEVLLREDYEITGSDVVESEATLRLKEKGATVHHKHQESNLKNVDVVVVSSAIPKNNPELLAAKKANIPVIQRAEMLGEIMRVKTGIAVAGTHGKTTTASIISAVMLDAGLDPTSIIGGKVISFDGNVHFGAGEFLIAEADESDSSFLHLPASIVVVTNIDDDHMNYFNDMDSLKTVFTEFINSIPFYGLAVLCIDDLNLKNILPRLSKPVRTYGFSSEASIQAKNIRKSYLASDFEVWENGEPLGNVHCNLPGDHIILNALASICVLREVGLSFKQIQQGFLNFKGVKRRFEVKAKKRGILLVDDYAHHPTEIKATLQAARSFWSDRIIAVFQPHRYSRIKDCYENFISSFDLVDEVHIMDIYPAGEEPIEGICAESLVKDISRHGHPNSFYIGDGENIKEKVCSRFKEGDMVITLGAGTISKTSENILQYL